MSGTPPNNGAHELTRTLPDAAATEALGREIALFARAGDWILLSGDLGTGKTTLARAFIRALAAPEVAEHMEVPSPTFTLVQPYEDLRIPVAHVDLYRLADPFEVDELGLEELARDHALLVEWPDRLPALPAERLEVHLADAEQGRARRATLRGVGDWATRLRRMQQVAGFLRRALGDGQQGGTSRQQDGVGQQQDGAGRQRGDADGQHVQRRFLQGDASARRYERLHTADGRRMILMDMPARPDGPALRGGKDYGALVHLARDVRAVAAVNGGLLRRGYSAPEVLAHDFDAGLLLLEDFGDAVFGNLYRQGMMEELLAVATDVLADMARRDWPREAPLPDGSSHTLADYDDEALAIEAELLIDWFWPHVKNGETCPPRVRESFLQALAAMLAHARPASEQPVWVLRDYHSPNLIWLPERDGLRRVGLIDTQDAVLGPAAYDLVSLLQDARISVPEALEQRMLAHYVAARQAADSAFDAAAFRLSYAVMGAQRALKVLGIFARLNMRDGKPGYLAHLPRVAWWLRRNLLRIADLPQQGAGALADMAAWLDEYLPETTRLAARHEDETPAETEST